MMIDKERCDWIAGLLSDGLRVNLDGGDMFSARIGSAMKRADRAYVEWVAMIGVYVISQMLNMQAQQSPEVSPMDLVSRLVESWRTGDLLEED